MRSKVLLIVEGHTEEPRILGALGKQSFGLLSLVDAKYEIIIANGSIYELYDAYKKGEYDDLVAYLRSRNEIQIDSDILSKNAFAAIYLIFDFDPQYQKYSDNAIREMLALFDDETDLGKLYISYPMVEAVYHLRSLPDKEYDNKVVDLTDFSGDDYKKLVYNETCIKKNKLSKKELSFIVMQNYNKAKMISEKMSYEEILEKQIEIKNKSNKIYVLSTLPLMILDYNEELAMRNLRLKLKHNFIVNGYT